MKHLFLADDGAGFWLGWDLSQYIPHLYSRLDSDKRSQLLADLQSLHATAPVLLVSDARFQFEGEPHFGGSRLCREFLNVSPPNSIAVVYSEEPLVRTEDADLPGLRRLTSRLLSTDWQLVRHLLEGGKPSEVPALLSMIKAVLVLKPLLALYRDDAGDGTDCFRPPTATSDTSVYISDVCCVGFPENVVTPFSDRSADLFTNEVFEELKDCLRPDQIEWTDVKNIVDPYDSLQSCGRLTADLRGRGALRCFWELAKCGGRAELMPVAVDCDRLTPDEQLWVRQHRLRLRKFLTSLLSPHCSFSLGTLIRGALLELNVLQRLALRLEEFWQ